MNKKDFWNAVETLSPPLFKTYCVINELSNNDVDYCFSGGEYLEKKLGKDKDNITKDIKKLIDLGFLNVIYLKSGFKIIERRIYTAKNYKTYLEDLENFQNLIVTTYENIDGAPVYYNERSQKNATDKNIGGVNDKNIGGADDKNVGQIDTNINNKILNSKTEEPVAVSDKESKIRFIANIEKIKLDKKFIKELANKFSLEKITEWLKAVPQDKKSNNAGAYIRGIIKNQKLDSVPKTVTKKSEKIKTIEEPLNTPKMSEKELRDTFLDGRQIKDLEPQQLQILNDTLRRMGYGQAR